MHKWNKWHYAEYSIIINLSITVNIYSSFPCPQKKIKDTTRAPPALYSVLVNTVPVYRNEPGRRQSITLGIILG